MDNQWQLYRTTGPLTLHRQEILYTTRLFRALFNSILKANGRYCTFN